MFVEVPVEHLQINPFTGIGGDGFLITAGTPDRYNMMTANWGSMGVLWKRNILSLYVRGSRYTHSFLEESEGFTVSFFPPDLAEVLTWCGKHSGREYDKLKETGLKPAFIKAADGSERVTFKEATLIFSCTKAALTRLDPATFVAPEIGGFYEKPDYHTHYIGFVDSILTTQ